MPHACPMHAPCVPMHAPCTQHARHMHTRCACLVATVCLLHLLWWQGVFLLPRPLRRPRRYHAELSLDADEAQLLHLFAALDATARLAATLTALLWPLAFAARLFATLRRAPATPAAPPATPPAAPPAAPHAAPPIAPHATRRAAAPPAVSLEELLRAASLLPRYEGGSAALLLPAGLPPAARQHLEVCAHAHECAEEDAAAVEAAAAAVEAEEAEVAAKPAAVAAAEAAMEAAVEAAMEAAMEAGCVLDCSPDASLCVLGHHPPPAAAALAGFVAQRTPAFPFGLLATKPPAQALCAALEAEAVRAARGAAPRAYTARLMLSAADATEAAVRLCLVRWHARTHPLTAASSAAAAAKPVILMVGGGPRLGSTWLLAGLPTANLRLEALPSPAHADTHAHAHAHADAADTAGQADAGSSERDDDEVGDVAGDEVAAAALQAALRSRLAALCEVGTDGVRRCACAAVVIETVCGASGAVRGGAGWRAACDEYGVLLVAEETTCGLGRCGPLLPALAWGMRPHVTCVGEALGGGYCSVAAVLWEAAAFGKEAMPFPSTATLCNDNLASHVGLATLAALRARAPRTERDASAFCDGVRATLAHASSFSVRGCGLRLRVRLSRAAEARLMAAARAATASGGDSGGGGGVPRVTEAWPANLILHASLLAQHKLRCRPSAADPRVLLLEPPAVGLRATTRHVADALLRCDALLCSAAGCAQLVSLVGAAQKCVSRVKNGCLLSRGTYPPLWSHGRAARNGVDRTAYSTRQKKMSFVTYHTQRISKNIVHCGATATLEKIAGGRLGSAISLAAGATRARKARRWLRFGPAAYSVYGLV
eukprot:scaffold38627_cov66-Phaeocystis_antarctica.AAC.3